MSQTPCPHCQTTIRHGERYGCCSGCGRMFAGQAAFDAHQRNGENGMYCVDVTTDARRDGQRRFIASEPRHTSGNGTVWSLTQRPGQVNPWAKREREDA